MTTALKLVHNADSKNQKHDYINYLAQSEPKKWVLFTEFITDTVKRRSRRMGKTYGQNYKTLVNHILTFSELYDASIYTNSVNERFLEDFVIYLQDLGLKLNYISNLIVLIKCMCKKAGTYGFAVDPTYDDFELEKEKPFSVYLSMNEITRIYYFKGLTRFQEQIKDLFIVGCLTALRYSDYSTLTPMNFIDNYIVKVTKKTNTKVTIPIHDYVKEIYTKYDGVISKNLSIQHFNRYIKMICQKVGLTNDIIYSYTRGGKLITERKQKWELISSHTARRSAATNMYLTGRMKTFEIMALTGHTTEKSFFRYIKITNEDTARQIAGDNFFRA